MFKTFEWKRQTCNDKDTYQEQISYLKPYVDRSEGLGV